MAKVVLESGKEQKIKNFYPNVYKDEIKHILGSVENGDIVEVCTHDGEIIAKGYVVENTNSFVRILTTKNIIVDKKLIFEKIKKHIKKRTTFK